MTGLEIAANVASAACIFLAGRNNIHTWWTGIVGCSLFALLFYQSQLYADVVLQVFFVVTGMVGWVQWLRGNKGDTLPITHAQVKTLMLILPVALAATAAYGALLHFYTQAYAPFFDSAVLVFSVIAQFLLMQRKVDNWPVWILVNSIAVPLYASRGLYLTSFLYACYWINAVVAWYSWRHLARQGVPASVEAVSISK